MPVNWSQDKYREALFYAAKAHGSQLMPGAPFPYVTHLTLVAMEVINALGHETGLNGDLAVSCALLHDVIEDTSKTCADVLGSFGKEIADGVDALSKKEPQNQNFQNKAELKRFLIKDSLKRIKKQPKEIWMVKMADRISNLIPPPLHWTRAKIAAYQDEARLIHNELKEASPYLADRLSTSIDNYSRYL